jgi:peptidoglycan/LPS O-acetylase OafA/YrhL
MLELDVAGAHTRIASIDLIKGIAIIAVIFLHTLSARALHQTVAVLHISQAVPVFMFLIGLNGAAALRRRDERSLRGLYGGGYLESRLNRIFVPFLLIFALAALLGALTDESHYGVFTPIGELPIGGPGNYFIPLLFQFVLLFPLIFWGLQRRRAQTLLLCLGLNVGFEIFAPHVGLIATHPYLYEVCFARYLFVVSLGALLAQMPARKLLGAPWFWACTLLSVGYLGVVYADNSAIPFAQSSWRADAFAAAFDPSFLVVLGIVVLPDVATDLASRCVAELGRASYHVFLVQILWFGLVKGVSGSAAYVPLNLLVTGVVGVAFYRSTLQLSPLGRTSNNKHGSLRTAATRGLRIS